MAADPRPANDHAPIGPSLFDRAWGAARARPEPAPTAVPPRRAIDRIAVVTAALILAGPLATLIAATWRTGETGREASAIAARAAPGIAARAGRDRARGSLQAAWSRPGLGTTIEAVARALPAEATLLRAERLADGRLLLEVAAPDPDRLTAALRRDPALGGLRARAQVPGDGAMRVTLEQVR